MSNWMSLLRLRIPGCACTQLSPFWVSSLSQPTRYCPVVSLGGTCHDIVFSGSGIIRPQMRAVHRHLYRVGILVILLCHEADFSLAPGLQNALIHLVLRVHHTAVDIPVPRIKALVSFLYRVT